MQKKRNTKLNAVLSDIDESFLPNGKRKVFSIGFFNSGGEYVFMISAVKSGLKQNQKKGDFKGVAPVDMHGNEIGHPYPIYIHFIKYYKSNTLTYEN